jgi:hypothetical protein
VPAYRMLMASSHTDRGYDKETTLKQILDAMA